MLPLLDRARPEAGGKAWGHPCRSQRPVPRGEGGGILKICLPSCSLCGAKGPRRGAGGALIGRSGPKSEHGRGRRSGAGERA
eukprot:scaffold1522_cov340-Prasinococcus_capsulatus_cf.AAC.9